MKKHKQIAWKCVRMYIGAWLLAMATLLFYAEPVHAADRTAEVRIPVSCTSEDTSESYTYELSGGGSEYETVKERTLKLTNGKSGAFTITYNYPNIYHYTVSQKKGTNDKIEYDTTVYQVDVYVLSDDNGNLHADPVVYIKGSNTKKAKLEFTNKNKEQKKASSDSKNQSDQASGTTSVKTPKTGDTARPELLILLAVLAMAGIWFLSRRWGKDKEDDET